MNDDSSRAPRVSVIVPVYNDPEGIRRCLDSLTSQTYQEDKYEIIVVDNGSSDETPKVVQEYPVELCFETDIQSSYAARNTGINQAKGDILAFTDADCVPDKAWLENGVRTLEAQDADIAAGRIKMTYPKGQTASERYDAQGNMRNDLCERRGVAKTANIFIRRRVFNGFELFPSKLISGGDVYWTRTAVDAGYDLIYAEDATVEHSARDLQATLKKKFRIGRGNVQMWNMEGKSPPRVIFRKILLAPTTVLQSDSEDEISEGDQRPPDRDFEVGIQVIIVSVLATVAQNLGRFYAMLSR